MILAGLPCGQLEEIKRNSGGIVEACDSIRRDQPWETGDNLIGCEASTTDGQITAMLETIKSARKQGFDPVWDCQVVVAVNKRSPLARSEINTILQNELNHRPGVPGCKFRIGDKIVNTKNDYFPSVNYESDEELQVNERGDVYVANGELAEVIEVQKKLIVAKLNSPSRTIRIPFGQTSESASDDDAPSTGCSWDLGYALSVHKSQGSEWPIVITMLDESMGAKMVCDRAWLYTAISRAKQTCYLIGKKSVADRFCRTNKMHQRKTLLKERILLESATNQLGEL
jgi:exodeoxyribonuclease V alpha subunit